MRQGPLRHRWFAGFIGAFGLGAVADEVARLALPLLLLDLTHSIAAAAALRVVQSIPYILFGAPAGALIDRADKRRLLIVCDAASVLLTATIPLSAIFGFFSVGFLFLIGFLLGTVDAFMPAGATMRHETRHWTTNEAYGDGAVMTVGQGYGDDTMLMVDLFDEAVDAKIAELRLWKAQEGEEVVNAGTLHILGQGVWAVNCDPS